MEELIFVPLQSILINRDRPVDALDLFNASGKAVRFTPGEIERIVDENGGLEGRLREPLPHELP